LKRWIYVAFALGTIALGLAVHSYGGALNPTSRDVIGDVLWAAMIAWWIGAINPRAACRVHRALSRFTRASALSMNRVSPVPGRYFDFFCGRVDFEEGHSTH